METDDLARDGEADARAVGFGREEWREDIFGHLLRDCLSVVGYLDLDALLRVDGWADSYLALVVKTLQSECDPYSNPLMVN